MVFYFFLTFIYLTELGLSFGMWDLSVAAHKLYLWPVGSVVVVYGLWSAWAELLQGRCDLCSPTSDQTHVSCIAREMLNH